MIKINIEGKRNSDWIKSVKHEELAQIQKQFTRQGLTKKEIDVHLADGSTYKSHRWVRPDGDTVEPEYGIRETIDRAGKGTSLLITDERKLLDFLHNHYTDEEMHDIINRAFVISSGYDIKGIIDKIPIRFVSRLKDNLKERFKTTGLLGVLASAEKRIQLHETLGLTHEMIEYFAKNHKLPPVESLPDKFKAIMEPLSDLDVKDPSTDMVLAIDELYKETILGDLHKDSKHEWEQNSSKPWPTLFKESLIRRGGDITEIQYQGDQGRSWREQYKEYILRYPDEVIDAYVDSHQELMQQLFRYTFPGQDTVELWRGTGLDEVSGGNFNEGDEVGINQNPISSWSMKQDAPKEFAEAVAQDSDGGEIMSYGDFKDVNAYAYNDWYQDSMYEWMEEHKGEEGSEDYGDALVEQESFLEEQLEGKLKSDYEEYESEHSDDVSAVVLHTVAPVKDIWSWFASHAYHGNEREVILLGRKDKTADISDTY